MVNKCLYCTALHTAICKHFYVAISISYHSSMVDLHNLGTSKIAIQPKKEVQLKLPNYLSSDLHDKTH